MSSDTSKSHDIISGVIAILPSLAPVAGAVSGAVTNIIDMRKILFIAEALAAVNFFTLLISICFIALLWYSQDSRRFGTMTQSRFTRGFLKLWYGKSSDDISMYAFSDGKDMRRLVMMFSIMLVALGVFIWTVALKLQGATSTVNLFVLQSVSYILFVALTSAVIFLSIRFYVKRKAEERERDFVENLRETLVRYGYFKTHLEILSDTGPQNMDEGFMREVICRMNGDEYRLIVDYTGTEIRRAEPLRTAQQTAMFMPPSGAQRTGNIR